MCLNIDSNTFSAYSDALQATVLTTTRLAATSLPADLSFHRSIDTTLARDIDAFSDRVLSLAGKLVHIASGNANKVQEEEDVVDEFVRNFADPMEGMLESTDSALDVFLGRRRDPVIHVPATPVDHHENKQKKQQFCGRLDPALTHASHIQKPQTAFRFLASNTDESSYIPTMLMPHKWCAKVPLGYVFDEGPHGHEDDNDGERRRSLHPYYYELTHPSYPDHVYNPPADPSPPPPLRIPSSGTPTISNTLTFVSTSRAFLSMAQTISSATELAVDLEHHSYRSYKGFLALMQISTRKADFVVDLLIPEIREGLRQQKGKRIESEETRMAEEAGQIISRVFADPSIIKVFHGAESDVVWLQQDFNIFVVGLFDTFHASKVLEFPRHSLGYLLETYCDFIPDKRYQLADWRIRPLPSEMLAYASSDTHFLLYIYDVLRLLLVEQPSTPSAIFDEAHLGMDTEVTNRDRNLIAHVLDRSSRTALRLYDVEVYDVEGGTGSNGWATLARKWNKIGLFDSSRTRGIGAQGTQAAVYKAVHQWREDVAREEDESTRYVLPTHHLFLFAERAPTTVKDLLSLCGGPGGLKGIVPPILRRRTGELVAVIKGAVDAAKLMIGPQDVEMTTSQIMKETEVMRFTTRPLNAQLTDESRLWASSASTTTISIPRSSLFGAGIPGKRIIDVLQ